MVFLSFKPNILKIYRSHSIANFLAPQFLFMNSHKIKPDRRKFVYWTAGILSALAFWKIAPPPAPEQKTVKMLSEDGELVEIDEKYLAEIRNIKRSDEAINCAPNTIASTGRIVKTPLNEIKNFIKRK